MKEIAQALGEYQTLLDNLKWLQENGQLPADADIGELAFKGAIYFCPPHVVEAFVAVMDIAKAERERLAMQPKRVRASSSGQAMAEEEARQQREKEIKERARLLSCEFAVVD